jgi:hypothetical protein
MPDIPARSQARPTATITTIIVPVVLSPLFERTAAITLMQWAGAKYAQELLLLLLLLLLLVVILTVAVASTTGSRSIVYYLVCKTELLTVGEPATDSQMVGQWEGGLHLQHVIFFGECNEGQLYFLLA